MTISAFIGGCAGPELTDDERAFFRETDPWGLILFARNCATAGQVSALVADFRACVGREDAPVLIDQEGGRVQRIGPPDWRAYPPAEAIGALYEADPRKAAATAYRLARLMAGDLSALGITVDCVPVLDVRDPDGHDVIGDRAYGDDPVRVAALGRAVCEGMLDGGVLPVVKHIPGHGRAGADSHLSLPVVDAPASALRAVDFAPFRALNDMPLAMTAHVVYTALDRDRPATCSSAIVKALIRGEIGFDGLLMSDDLSMKALSGTLAERTRDALGAGCDIVLHCNGELSEMQEVAAAAGPLKGRALDRAERALARLSAPKAWDNAEALADLAMLNGESV